MNRERVKNNFGEENHGESKQKDIEKREKKIERERKAYRDRRVERQKRWPEALSSRLATLPFSKKNPI